MSPLCVGLRWVQVGQYKAGEGNACHLCVLTFLGCRVGQYKEGEAIESAQEFARRIFLTCYMGTVNSGGDTKRRAAALAEQVRLERHKPSVLGCRLLAPSTSPMQSSTSQAQLACHWQEGRTSAPGQLQTDQMQSHQTNKIVCCVDWSRPPGRKDGLGCGCHGKAVQRHHRQDATLQGEHGCRQYGELCFCNFCCCLEMTFQPSNLEGSGGRLL